METQYIILIIGGTIILTILVLFIIAFIILYQKRYYKHLSEKQEMQTQFSQTLLQSQLEIQSQTLQNVSYEIHDNIGQVASLIKINLTTLNLQDTAKAAEKISDTKDLVKQLITDIKSLSVSLSGDRITKVGIINAIETEVERLNKMGQIVATIVKDDNPPTLSNETSIFLYRMVQEIVNNIVKHAKASQIAVYITNTKNMFTLAFKDNGIGFNVAEKMVTGGLGLSNLKNRAHLINAKIKIESVLNSGTTITIEVPT